MPPSESPSTHFEKRKRALFEASLKLSKAKRGEFLRDACRDHPGMLEAVKRLLAACREESDGVLNRPVCERKPQERELHPTLIGKYKVLKHLGTGGMGSVYLCSSPGQFDPVAVKIIRSDFQSPAARAHFEREKDVLKRLHHPNVCRLLDADVTSSGIPFIVMEYVQGEHLGAFCRRVNPSTDRRLRLFSQVLAGVEHCHSHSVVHRDLKPSNILVADDRVKILDFGLAKMITHAKGRTGHGVTNTASPFMTIPYCSPEQLSRRTSGRASDIYSLGLICYEFLTGQRPYGNKTESSAQVRVQALSGPCPAPPSYVVPGLSRSIDNLVANAMQFDPDCRYDSATRFQADLCRCLEGSSVERYNSKLSLRAAR